jgi:GntR family transcriptional regulator, transcriptional repressor for pyruvate dehydrogenase complex
VEKFEFESLKTKRATDIIENRISGLIINGKIKPREKLPTEKELSEQFDVSIVTIREALRGLEVAGMINKKRGKGGGIYVTEIDNESVLKALHNYFIRSNFSSHHLAEVRLMIEPTIVRMVAGHLPQTELKNLEENVAFCERRLAKLNSGLRLGDYRSLGEKHLEFHKLIAQATNNPVLVLTMDYILDFVADFKKSMFSPDVEFSRRLVEDHRGILNALKEGQSEKSEARMLAHLEYLEKYQMDESP